MDVPSLHTAKVKSQKIPKLLDLGSKRSGATKVFSAELPTFKFISNSALYILTQLNLFFFAHTVFKAQLFEETFERHSSSWALSTSVFELCFTMQLLTDTMKEGTAEVLIKCFYCIFLFGKCSNYIFLYKSPKNTQTSKFWLREVTFTLREKKTEPSLTMRSSCITRFDQLQIFTSITTLYF